MLEHTVSSHFVRSGDFSVRVGEGEGRGRTGSPLRPVGTRLGAASDGASIWGFGKLRGEGPGTQSGVVAGLGPTFSVLAHHG